MVPSENRGPRREHSRRDQHGKPEEADPQGPDGEVGKVAAVDDRQAHTHHRHADQAAVTPGWLGGRSRGAGEALSEERKALCTAPATHTTTTTPTHTAMPTAASTSAASGSVGSVKRRHDDVRHCNHHSSSMSEVPRSVSFLAKTGVVEVPTPKAFEQSAAKGRHSHRAALTAPKAADQRTLVRP
jgi:hypothetical protein